MGEQSNQLLLDALERAAVEPAGLPLFGGKKPAGLFATSAASKKTAQLCKDDGLLRVIRTESKGRSVQEICAITEKGLTLLLEQANPKNILETLVQTLEARRGQLEDLVDAAQRAQAEIDSLRQTTEKVLQELPRRGVPPLPPTNGNGTETISTSIMGQLTRWHSAGALEDYPLPQLYRAVCATGVNITVGKFHDDLRGLQEEGKVYLHPWTGPMYEIPEPVFALMVGHEIAYYASLRQSP